MQHPITHRTRLRLALLIALLTTVGCKPTTTLPASPVVDLDEFAQTCPISFALGLHSRPVEYPAQISIGEVEEFIRDKHDFGQGCGDTEWEGALCGMYVNNYGLQDTTWLTKDIALACMYAQTDTGTFLMGLRLGANTYRRPDRNSKVLIWERNYEPEIRSGEIHRTLGSGNSEKRWQLLTEISRSFSGVDIQRIPVEKRTYAASLIENCLHDSDAEVVALATSIIKDLRIN